MTDEQTIEEEILKALGEEDPELVGMIATMTEGRVEYWLRFADRARTLVNPRVRAWALLAASDAGYAAGVRGRELEALLAETGELVRAQLPGTPYEESLDVAELRMLRDAGDAALVPRADAMRAKYRGYGFFAACVMQAEHALARGEAGVALDLVVSSMRAKPDMLLSIRGLSDTRIDVALEAQGAGTNEVAALRAWMRSVAWEKVVR